MRFAFWSWSQHQVTDMWIKMHLYLKDNEILWHRSLFLTVKRARISGIHISSSHHRRHPASKKNAVQVLMNTPGPKLCWALHQTKLLLMTLKQYYFDLPNSDSAKAMWRFIDYVLIINLTLWGKWFCISTFCSFIKKVRYEVCP